MKQGLTITNDQIVAECCKRSLFRFVQEFWYVVIPEDPIYNWHIKYLCDEIQLMIERVGNREDKLYDLIINISPGSSKSTIATVMAPAWAWVIDPTMRNLTASYSASLSTDHALKSRDIIRSDKFKRLFPDIAIKHDQDNKTHYKNTKGGERYATSVTGTVTGFHAHLIIVDDPLNPKEASSEVSRESANDFMDRTLSTRKVSKSVTPTILVMQRLHELDCTGNWLEKKGKKLKHICIPGELSNDVKPEHLKENYVDGLFDPVRMTRNDLNDLRIDLGSYGYAGQIMQIPAPADGGIWKKWIIPIDREDIPEELQNLGTDWDTAYTAKDENSASAWVSAGIHDNKMYITDLGYKRYEFPKLVTFMKTRQSPHYIEPKASGKSLKQSLVSQGIPAVEAPNVHGDKVARATMSTPFAEAGMVYCDKRLIDMLYHDNDQGILPFPNGAHDDLQDALVQSIQRLLASPQIFVF